MESVRIWFRMHENWKSKLGEEQPWTPTADLRNMYVHLHVSTRERNIVFFSYFLLLNLSNSFISWMDICHRFTLDGHDYTRRTAPHSFFFPEKWPLIRGHYARRHACMGRVQVPGGIKRAYICTCVRPRCFWQSKLYVCGRLWDHAIEKKEYTQQRNYCTCLECTQ